MPNKYGIYQASTKSCIFYKEDEDGNQSTFNLFIQKDKENRDKLIAFIDNEGIKQNNWSLANDSKINEVIEAFGGWATDAPVVFEMEAHKSMSKCLKSVLKKE